MQVEVDQSGKIGKTNEDTVIAFSNGKTYAVLIPRDVKQRCIRALRSQGLSPHSMYTRLFAVALFFLLHNHITNLDMILIDVEYPGKNAQIKGHLLNLLRRSNIEVRRGQISFAHIGKKSNAHQVALEVFRGRQKANVILTEAEILEEF